MLDYCKTDNTVTLRKSDVNPHKKVKSFIEELCDLALPYNSSWIFRGQNAKHSLQADIFRQGKYTKTFEKSIKHLLPNPEYHFHSFSIPSTEEENKRLKEIVNCSMSELHLTEQFLLSSNKCGLKVPSIKLFNEQKGDIPILDFIWNFLQDSAENFLNRSKSYKYASFIRLEDLITIDSFALARHHGIASRLLDWTSNYLKAAFFATTSSSGGNISVYAFNRDYSYCGEVRLYEKFHNAGLEFLHLQEGVLLEMSGADGYFFRNGKWPTLTEYLEETISEIEGYSIENALRKVELVAEEKQALLNYLDKMGINKIRLMPTYDNVKESLA